MKKIFLIIIMLFISLMSFSQVYEIKQKTKVKQLFTVENIDSIMVKVKQLVNSMDTIYYNLSTLSTLVIYPKIKLVGIKEEEIK